MTQGEINGEDWENQPVDKWKEEVEKKIGK